MSDIINLLPDHIANQIAAGEVIQRPASGVKELLENAIDAGATAIKVIIKDAGKQLVQVIDNGCGMSETDARMSFERHATSKISKPEDLFAIRTMGFRGEALASIAAIAQVEMKTKRIGDELGTHLIVEGSEVKSQQSCQCPEGTAITVKDLFFNVPARRNFLKSTPVEMRHILDEFQRIAIAHPKIGFDLHHNDSAIFCLAPANLKQRIVSIFGKNYNQRLVPVGEATDIIKITGFVGKPEFAKKTRGEQFFFVNNRFIKSPYFHHAVVGAYQQILAQGSHPLYVVFMDLDPAKIDVNIHPTKQEVKFEEEKVIYAIIHATVKHALGRYSVTPTLDFDQEPSLYNLEALTSNKHQNIATVSSAGGWASFEKKSKDTNNWAELYKTDENVIRQPASSIQPAPHSTLSGHPGPTPIQIHQQYMLVQIKSGFILVDQQAAHERILYEKFMDALTQSKKVSQQQLFAKTIELSTADSQLLKDILPEIKVLGFDIEEFGKNTFVLNGVPADIKVEDEKELIEGLIEQFKTNATELKLDKRENLARSMAKRAAVKKGDTLSTEQMQNLLDSLFACQVPYQSPNGRLTFVSYKLDELENVFRKK